MNKICHRYYFSFLGPQERFLNRMAEKGWRLVRAGMLEYEFAPCAPGEYEYRVEFVGALSWGQNRDYAEFLRGMGYDVFWKNINLNWSLGKVQWRPYGKGLGQVATSPGAINKELLLVGKQRDGKPFQLHTTWADRARQQADFRNAWLALGLLLAVFAVWKAAAGQAVPAAVMGLPAVAALAVAWRLHRSARRCRAQGAVEEGPPGGEAGPPN